MKTVPDVNASAAPVTATAVEKIAVVDSPAIVDKPVVEATVKVKQTLIVTLFAIKDAPYYSGSNPITVSSSFPDGLLYTTQLAVFS